MSKLTLSLIFKTYIFLATSSLSSLGKAKPSQAATKPLKWWQESVVYQIYPRSFQDSDGDGTGDLKGLTSRIPYLKSLGVETVWISPFFKSPMKDFGYDISDFRDIDPIFGNLSDFAEMSQAFKTNGLKLVVDMVPNHSSDLHEWFIKSVNKEDPYTDYYVWKDPKGFDVNGKPITPNNWVSVFGGSMWEWNEQRQQFYLHHFVVEQPDLNYENPAVRTEMLAIFKFWLDLGVDGFRMDAVNHMFEDQRFLDEPVNPNRPPEALPEEYRYWDHIYVENQPGVFTFLADARQLIDVYSAVDGKVRCMMIEAPTGNEFVMAYYGTPEKPIAHFPFNFNLLYVRPFFTASQVKKQIDVWYDLMPEGEWATFLLGNHDWKRASTRWTTENVDGANTINLLLQGTAVTYYGEEIGMIDTFLSWEETVDPWACNSDPGRYHVFSRDPARTPMQWDNTTSGGFSSGTSPWLPLNPNYKTLNVVAQETAPKSHLKVYKELVDLRKTNTWRYGTYESLALNDDQVLGFTRIASQDDGGGAFLVLVNFSNETQSVDTTELKGVPSTGKVLVTSINFSIPETVIGGEVNCSAVALGPRNSLVIQLSSVIS